MLSFSFIEVWHHEEKNLIKTLALLSYRVLRNWEMNPIISNFASRIVPNSKTLEILLDTMHTGLNKNTIQDILEGSSSLEKKKGFG